MPNIKLQIGKIRSRGTKYPWEPGYVQAINEQCKDLMALIKQVVKQFEDVTPEICKEALEPTLELAKYYCPKDTGALVESAYLEVRGFRGQPRVEIGFARGGNPYYAVVVHENLEMHHEHPTQAKFLERAVHEDLPNIEERITYAYQEFMNG